MKYIYIVYHSVLPHSPTPSPASECAPPPRNPREGGTLACGERGGVPIPTTGEKA